MFPEYLIEHWLSQEKTQTFAVMRANPGAWQVVSVPGLPEPQDLTLSVHQVKNLFRLRQF